MIKQFDERVLEMMNDAIQFLEKYNDKELARERFECARQIVWLAEDLKVITYKEWDTINTMLHQVYYRIY